MLATITKFILTIATAYLLFVVGAYSFQRSLIYFPDTSEPRLDAGSAQLYQRILVPTPDGLTLQSWFKMPAPGRYTILFLHGNAGNISLRVPIFKPYIERGYGVLLLEYRGYGGNPGKPSEQGLYQDARGAMDELAKLGIPARDVIVYGSSLGTGVAVQIAGEYPVGGVILQSPFTSLVDVAENHYPYLPVRMLMKDRYDSLSKIKKIKAPILFMHGEADEVIPHSMSQRLSDAANEPKLVYYYRQRGHHNMITEQMQQDVLAYLNALQPSN